MKKTYVLDTNVLLGDPNALNAFDDNDLIIPLVVLEELDRHKNRQDDVGACARQVNRMLDMMRKLGKLIDGVETKGGGTVKVVSANDTSKLPAELDASKVDNKLLAFMLATIDKLHHASLDRHRTILVSRDINVRIKCDALGILCQDYKKLRVASSIEEFYKGVVTHDVSEEYIDRFYDDDGAVPLDEWGELFPNQIIVIKFVEGDRTIKSAIARVIDHPEFVNMQWLQPIKKTEKCFGLLPRNKEQNFSLDLLFDPEVKLVTLVGPSGTGKTLMALAAGLEQHTHLGINECKRYERLVVTRSVQPVGRDLGYLPGTMYEKMEPWLAPVRDNLDFLMSRNGKKQQSPQKNGSKGQRLDPYFSLMMEKGLIEVEAVSYMRGRSISDSYIVIDEAQNLTVHELKTIITRVGENTKIVLTGDVEQIDNVNVDVFTNGLTYAIERFKRSKIAGHVTLLKGERSALATEASRIL